MFNCNMNIVDYDPILWNAMEQEKMRQEEHIELIASENYTSPRVMQAQGSYLTNKYAEGYPGQRYYGGCQYVDIIEQLAIDRAKKLFGADYANVQPHSGSQANFAVYAALLEYGDTVLSMKLTHGGHLSHGSSVNLSGKLYNVISYNTDKAGHIDYNQIDDLAVKHQPKMIIGGFSSYSGLCNWKKMREIADRINAYLVIDMAHVAGLIAAKIYPNPIPHAHIVTSTTHKTLAGPRGGIILAAGGDEKLYAKINASVFPGGQGGPLLHVIAGKAVAFKEAMEPEFTLYQKNILQNSKCMVEVFLQRGYNVVSGGTHNHLFLLNLVEKKLTGQQAENILGHANITLNKNSIPDDPQSAFVTSGIRIGSAAVTRRGFQKNEVCLVAKWISDILDNPDNESIKHSIKKQVIELCSIFPVYECNSIFYHS
ncbi:Serine hydroxymethyltransferase [Candidatus Erwinia haradaeae]|uniref:Serine hydroxymethyltransferase n=1 Tax=Candidatus Erwinia haradaeae TaxID=1922217 RepID=A0A451DDA1_9GAMM|nr:serine hydroxymethyltransferase [Candidatus Erwinia haradaeae]VFP84451.1 Serine hydroxymethyltransferase [Candidatus Erwinia haradaeae]